MVDNLKRDGGLYYSKSEIVKRAMEEHDCPVLWMDYNDVRVTEKLSSEEIEFLSSKPLAFEWESKIRRGPPLHNKKGDLIVGKGAFMPQNGIYFMNSIDFMNKVLEFKPPCDDQMVFAHVLENEYSIFQDSQQEDLLPFSRI